MNGPWRLWIGAIVAACAIAGTGCGGGDTGSSGGGTTTTTTGTAGAAGSIGGGGTGGTGGTTGGTGGNTGGTGGVTGGTGGGTGGAVCDPAQCPPPSTECMDAVCDGGQCAEKPKADGTVLATQIAGDCKKSVCQAGAVAAVNDDLDLPDDANECTDDVCAEGVASNPPKAIDTACGMGGASFCDGAGKCAQCTAPAQCPGQDGECQSRTCDMGACGIAFVPQGTATMAQTMGDCQVNQCNGAGAIETVAAMADVQDDGNPCTDDSCNGNMPVHTPTAIQTPCGAGLKCDGAGMCVGCITTADCQAPGNACLVATCTAGMCGTANKADGAACNDGNACTQSDTCQAGACTGANPVVCGAQDQCHVAGTCDVNTGVCSNPTKADGAACSDGNGCTLNDQCLAGACASGPAVQCVALDQCHSAGTCAPATGVCSNPNKANGSMCNDGNACTVNDSCQAGACAAGPPVVCVALDQCHDIGTCAPATGVCSNPNKANGTSCTDGNACTQTDTCQAGACMGANPVVCMAQDQCHTAGACNPNTGVCSNPNKANGSACNDGNGCTQTDTCQAGACMGANPVVCMAQDQCHVAGTCSAATGMCTNPTQPDGTACTLGAQMGTCGGGACAICGNGMIEGNEQCDDSNATPCDGCSPKCQLDTSITYATASGLAASITDDAYNGTQASMTCVNVTVTASGDSVVDYVCPQVNMTHTWVGDLTIKLFSPAGTAITLMSMPGVVEAADNGTGVTGDSSNLLVGFPITWKDGGPKSAELMGNTLASAGVVCRDDAACVYDPHNGAAAAGKLVNLVGQAGPGVWKLCVGDSGVGDIGSIDQVKLVVGQ